MSVLKIFPLNIALLPGEKVPLHIFEPRYKKLIDDCKEKGESFGICLSYGNKVSRFGTEVTLDKVTKTFFDGSSDVVVRGIRSFVIKDYHADPNKIECDEASTQFIDLFKLDKPSFRLLELYDQFAAEFNRQTFRASRLMNANLLQIAREIGLGFKQKDQFIREADQFKKEELLIRHIRYLLFIKAQEESREFNLLMN